MMLSRLHRAMSMQAEISKEFTFEAAHYLPTVGQEHKCSRLHGHLYRVEVTIRGDVDPMMGWVMDFGELAAVCREVIGQLDHRVLNEIHEIGVPTTENIASYLCDRLAARLPLLVEVTVHESPTSRCTVRRHEIPRNETVSEEVGPFVFSAAHFLLSPDGGRESLHGHDYMVKVRADFPRGHPQRLTASCVTDAIKGLAHRLLLPSHPVVGTLAHIDETVRLVLPQEVLVFKASDVAFIEAVNTTAECIAHHLAKALERSPEIKHAIRAMVMVCEGQDSWAYVYVGDNH